MKRTKTDPLNRVLIIDDDIDVLTVLEILLTMEGYMVDTHFSSNGLQEKIDKFKPGIILLNSKVGSEKGIDICKIIKNKNREASIRIIILSNNVEEKHANLKYADGFLTKPVDIKRLVKKIHSILQ